MYRKMLVSVVVLCALLAVPLNSNTGNAAKSNPAALPAQAQTDQDKTFDDRLAAVAMQVPGFGGMFFDQDGTLQVYMAGQREPANEALTSLLEDVLAREIGSGERLSSRGMEIREAKYNFLELARSACYSRSCLHRYC
jgi:hypothetical protein